MISVDDPHLDEAVREAHPEVVLAVLGRGVDQPSARSASDVQPGQQGASGTITITITIVTREGSSVPRPCQFGPRQSAQLLTTW